MLVLVQRNSVPSAHMRCMITAIRRATATTDRFIPRYRAISMPQALSHDHLMVRVIMTWAAANSSLRIIPPAFRYAAYPVDFARLVAARRQAEHSTDCLGVLEPGRNIDRRTERQRD